ncbi:MAG: hypothetical protein GY854_34295 [Deltaproteobacteria bacterium]|nr:hypothetical protein [Deltaproteobacteria bacterium]
MTTTQAISFHQTRDLSGATSVARSSDLAKKVKENDSLRPKPSTAFRGDLRADSPAARAIPSQVTQSVWQQEFAATEANRMVRGNAVLEIEEGPSGRRVRVEKEVIYATEVEPLEVEPSTIATLSTSDTATGSPDHASTMDEIRSRRAPVDKSTFTSYRNARAKSAYHPPPSVERDFESIV